MGTTLTTLTGIYFQDKIFLEWGKVIATEKLTTNIFLTIRNLMKTYEGLGQNFTACEITHKKTRNFAENFILIYSEVGRNLKIRSIYMPHYENKFKHWMTGAIKRIDHAMRDEGTASTSNPVEDDLFYLPEPYAKSTKAREFADLSRECPKRAKSDTENKKQDSSQESGPNSNECSESELKIENEMATTIYKIKLEELNDETDGWDLRDVLEMYIKAGRYTGSSLKWTVLFEKF